MPTTEHRALLVGSGAREHCIAEALRKNPAVEVYAVVGNRNPGIVRLAKETVHARMTDFETIGHFVDRIQPNLAIIGPEAPLAAGIADFLEKKGVPTIGPKKSLSQVESSKSFCRLLMKKYGIDGLPEFAVFDTMHGLQEYMNTLTGVVVKPDGLTGGKGVKVEGDHFEELSEAIDYCQTIIQAGERVVVEEKLEGEEFSLQCFTDGSTVVPMPIAQDHKRAFEHDQGPNTGGMGSYSCPDHLLPFLTKQDKEEALRITRKVIEALLVECGEAYKGIIYGGFMKTAQGIKLIEYNCRFGDPEAMNALPLLRTDLYGICEAIVKGRLDRLDVRFELKASVCKYIVPEGYPQHPVRNERIRILRSPPGSLTFYASVDESEGELVLKGSRAVAFVGIAESTAQAEAIAQEAAQGVEGPVFLRKDIGTDELISSRVEHMRELLGD